MIDRLVDASLANRPLVLIGLLLLAVLGLRSLAVLPIDAVPDVTNVQVQVLTQAPGQGPLEVEQNVTTPVEIALGGLPRLEELRSISRFGVSAVTVVFEEGTDLYWARQLVAERLGEARSAIPEGYGEPELGPPSTGLGEIVQFEVVGDSGVTLMDLRDALEWQIAPALRQVPGVVEVNTFGGELRTFTVEPNPDELRARGLVLADVFEALERNGLTVGGGAIEHGPEQVLLRGVAPLQSAADVASVVVRTTPDGTPVTIGDLGRVVEAPMQRQGSMTRDGTHEGAAGVVMMGIGENSRTVAQRVGEALADLEPSLPKGVRVDVFYDRTQLVDRTIRTVVHNLIEGGLLVVAVLLLLLGNLRAGLVVASAIPLAMLAAVACMVAAGVSGNLMSLGAIDFGLLVDGAVVVVENSLRLAHERRSRGRPVTAETFGEAAREVARPVAFAVGVIILVYLPLLTLGGIEGKMFRPMAQTVVFALSAALALTLVAMPTLASLVLRDAEERETWLVRLAHRRYEPLLRRAVDHPRATAAIAGAGFAVGLVLVPFLGAEFVPTLDEGAIGIEAVRQPSVSVTESAREASTLEAVLKADFPDEVQTVVCRTGQPEIATDPMGIETSDVFVMLTPREQWTRADDREELASLMGDDLDRKAPGMRLFFSQPIEQRTNELIEGVRADVAIVVRGDDLDVLRRLGDQIARVVGRMRQAESVKVEKVAGLPMLTARVDRRAISRLGLDATDVLDAISAVGGRTVGELNVGQRRYALQVRWPEAVRQDQASLATLPIGRSGGTIVPLGAAVSFDPEEAPLQISHEGGQRRLTVEVDVRGRDLAGFVAEAKARIRDQVELPPGYRLEWGGTFQNLTAASARLALVVPLVLILIFALLQANFRSVRLTLLVYANVPLAVTGGLVALALRGLPLSISAGVGFIALCGVAVMNGVVLLSSIQALHRAGRSAREAAEAGARLRLRPVLTTALVAALGFVPMALATSAGAEVQRPLATVVIGGLVTCTALTLMVLPAAYAAWIGEPEST